MNKIKQKYVYSGIAVLFILGVIIFSSSTFIPKGNQTASILTPLWNFLGYSSEKEILSYDFKNPVLMKGTFEEYDSQKYIFVEVPVNIKKTGLIPIIKVSPEATVSPASGFSPDYFKQPVVYTVTAGNGETQTYKVYISGVSAVEIPIQISTCEQLQAMNNNPSGKYTLANDIDCSMTKTWNGGAGFIPIGLSMSNPQNAFSGSLEGKGFTIGGIYMRAFSSGVINGSSIFNSYVGVFGAMKGSISNVKVVGADIGTNGDYYFTPIATGGLVGNLLQGGSIINSSFSGTVSASRATPMGGLVGKSFGNIENSYSTGSVYSNSGADSKWYSGIGGLVGINGGTIKNSYSSTNVTAVNTVSGAYDKVGGLTGVNSGTIKDSYFIGKITSKFPGKGCLVGYNIFYSGPDWTSTAIISATGTTTNSYCDIGKSGVLDTTYGGVGKTTAEMKTSNTFVGWDTNTIWNVVDGYYPNLKTNSFECTRFDYSEWTACSRGTQTRTVIPGCVGGVTPVTSQSCIDTCKSFTYSPWSACTNNIQTRTVIGTSPSVCIAGNPIISRFCADWSPEFSMNGVDAENFCKDPANGYTRLPTKDEISISLIEQFINKNPSVTGFVKGKYYWFSNDLNVSSVNTIVFDYGNVWFSTTPKSGYTRSFRCIR
jgi:hypothetical protein